MKRRDIDLDEYNISKNRYRELYYFCKQYWPKKRELDGCYDIRPQKADGMPRTGKDDHDHDDPTFETACRILRLKEDIEIIEKSAIAADPGIWRQIIKNVTQGISYDDMIVPCGRRQFYNLRRKFFFILNQKQNRK